VVPTKLLTSAEVAQYLRISARTVRLWAECAVLPAVRVGKQWRFRRTELEGFLKASEGSFDELRPSPHAKSRSLINKLLSDRRRESSGPESEG